MKRLNKILKWTGVVLGVLVAVGLIVNAWFVWTTDARLASQLEAIRAAGEPLTLADLARPPIPPEENAATYFQRAEADVRAIEDRIFNKDYYDGWGKQWNSERRLPSEGVKAVKAALDAHPKAVPLLEQAAACADYDAGLDYTVAPDQFITAQLLPVIQRFRSNSRVLHFRVHLFVAEGNRDEAVRTGLLIFSLAKYNERNPTLVSYLVTITIQGIAVDAINFALQAGPVSDEVRNALDAELNRQERLVGYLPAVISERAFLIDSFRAVPGRNLWLYKRGYWNEQESGCLEMLKILATLAESPMPYRKSKKIILATPTNIRESIVPFGDKLYPIGLPCEAVLHNAARARARIRSLRVLNALQTHVAAASDDAPELSKLGLPVETTIDPFTDSSLHVKKTPQGWLVYSVGPNLRNDGGKLLGYGSVTGADWDIGVGPPPAGK